MSLKLSKDVIMSREECLDLLKYKEALEIIKSIKGLIDKEDLFYDSEEDKYYFFSNEISKEQYDLLKEVLL